MSDEERSIQKNKTIILVAVLIITFFMVSCILLNSTANDTVYFHYAHNLNTGEPIGLIGSIVLYVVLWGFSGIFPAGINWLLITYLYFFLHRKDKNVTNRFRTPKYEEEHDYGTKIAFVVSYIAAGILIILHVSNIVTMDFI